MDERTGKELVRHMSSLALMGVPQTHTLPDGYRIQLAPWGRRELLLIGLPLLIATVLIATLAGPWAPLAFVPGVVLAALLWFFRDPPRAIPVEEAAYVSPADGRVTDVTHLDEYHFFGGPATRVGIFLSVLDVHVNRVPAEAEVVEMHYAEGARHDARTPEATDHNESQWIGWQEPCGARFAVRQVSGAVARRIVCPLSPGDHYGRGERFGMIKFGSRTELIVPAGVQIAVKAGDRVHGGSTILARR